MNFRPFAAACVCAAAIVCVASTVYPGVRSYKRFTIREEVEKIDRYKWVDKAFTVSPDGRHVAMLAEKDDARSVVIDGMNEPWFTHIEEGTITFSPDGSRHAYVAFLRNHQIVMLDGVPQNKYPRIIADKPVFSRDSSRVAYVALDERGEFAVDGDTEGPVFKKVDTRQMTYMADGSLVYVAEDGNEMAVMKGGLEVYRARYVSGLKATGDGSRLVFSAGDGTKWRVVADGVEQPEYDFVEADSISIKPDGTPVYVAAMARERFVVDGDKEGPRFRVIIKDTLAVSANGEMTAYGVVDGDRQYVIVNGITGSKFDRVGPPVFSPDGTRFAYTAGTGQDWYVVVDGNAEGPYMGVSMKSLTFSPDSIHFSYSARVKKLKWAVFLNGEDIYQLDGVSGGIYFGPLSRRVAFAGVTGRKQYVAINADVRNEFDAIVTWGGGRVWFGDEYEVRYFAVDKRRIYYVEEWPEPSME